MANTTNFGWETPDDTDLVKDGAAAIRTLGSAIDTSLVDLKGGTTGQVLAKASNTDMDFTWATDASGIPATIFDAKGDLIVASAADTAARLAVGTNGYVLTANSGATNGVEWAAVSAGGMTLINTGGTTLTGASVTISSIPATYNDLIIKIYGVRPATDGTSIKMYYNSDTGSNYSYVTAPSNNNGFVQNDLSICDDTDNGVNTGFIYVEIPNYANTSTWKTNRGWAITSNKDTPANVDFDVYYGAYNQTSAISSITFKPNSGNWTSGTLYVYGVK